MKDMRDQLYSGLKEKLEDIKLNGHSEKHLTNTLSLSFLGIDTNMLLHEIKDFVSASARAACHSGGVEISYVLKAMNVPVEWARGTLRLSTGIMTTKDEIEYAINIISEAVIKLKNKKLNKEEVR